MGGDISVISGTVNDGDKVPLPQGCSADDCKTMLAVYNIRNTSVAGGNAGLSPLYGFSVSMDDNRQATVSQLYTSPGRVVNSIASYIVVGQKQISNPLIPQIKF